MSSARPGSKPNTLWSHRADRTGGLEGRGVEVGGWEGFPGQCVSQSFKTARCPPAHSNWKASKVNATAVRNAFRSHTSTRPILGALVKVIEKKKKHHTRAKTANVRRLWKKCAARLFFAFRLQIQNAVGSRADFVISDSSSQTITRLVLGAASNRLDSYRSTLACFLLFKVQELHLKKNKKRNHSSRAPNLTVK